VSVKPSACKAADREFAAANIAAADKGGGIGIGSKRVRVSLRSPTHHDHLIHSHTPLNRYWRCRAKTDCCHRRSCGCLGAGITCGYLHSAYVHLPFANAKQCLVGRRVPLDAVPHKASRCSALKLHQKLISTRSSPFRAPAFRKSEAVLWS
jgi:hypothetical protein